MNKAELEKLFLNLTEHSRKSNSDLPSFVDSKEVVNALSEVKREAWKKLLSSVASVEATEDDVLKPVAEFFNSEPVLKNYLQSHAQDEYFHAELFKGYVKETFSYVKTKRSLTDQLIYDRALPFLANRAQNRPIPFALAVLFYERYASFFYEKLKTQAAVDGLRGLVRLIEAVEKDERRHMIGIESVVHYIQLEKKIDFIDRVSTRSLLELLLVDVNQSRYAIYNRKVRRSMQAIGIDPDYICEKGKWSAKQVYSLMEA